jgi:hypothetical protein
VQAVAFILSANAPVALHHPFSLTSCQEETHE